MFALLLVVTAAQPLDVHAYREHIEPMLVRVGCASGACHGSDLLELHIAVSTDDASARTMVDALRPFISGPRGTESTLLQKAEGKLGHMGGMNLDANGCDARMLSSWIAGTRVVPCPSGEPVHGARVPGVMDGDVLAVTSGCATLECHGGRTVMPRMLPVENPAAARVNAGALGPFVDVNMPGRTRLFRTLRGAGGHPRVMKDASDRMYRVLFAWLTGEDLVEEPAPSYAVFERLVQPMMKQRGCASSACHGGSERAFSLGDSPEDAGDNYLRIVARAERGVFPQKPLNTMQHGGGRRMGLEHDCATTTVRAWLARQEPVACGEKRLPSREDFTRVVQPSLHALTCTRCHEDGTGGFTMKSSTEPAALDESYASALRHVDPEFPAASSMLFRVRERCAYKQLLAWVGGERPPACKVDVSNFHGTFPKMPGE